MGSFARAELIAVLGPTNTGKTHLAIERMCGHASGMIGFPLRLLAREVYDRVVALKGAGQVALVTGEEKIVPEKARWFLCTAESMPIGRGGLAGADNQMPKDLAFVGIDEAQLGAHPERGHVFTDRLLRARGREETMILGSDALRPMLRALVPDAEIVSRPRFSTLSYAGPRKLSRLPKRSVIVAFSAEEVYAVAEMLRRLRGGAAVVMGSLSPRTRNAQVAMFQAGEVDYLVATDAIGMGLNMDVAHVAFASLRKFDGKRQRRLTVAEMAQIAGRAGRHQRDGTFGTLALDGGIGGPAAGFEPEEVAAIEGHHFPPLDHLYWRDGSPDTGSIARLIAALERRPEGVALRAAPQATDLAVLKRLAEEPGIAARAGPPAMVKRLWAACGLPDFRKVGAEHHARLVSRMFHHLGEGPGHLPVPWFADEVARLDSTSGDVETLADRIAHIRTWAYVAHRADWLADPAHWAGRTREVEERLSDALHERLTQRFVDRRTTVLMRDLGARGADALPVTVAPDGAVRVDGEVIGRLSGFRFTADDGARHADMKRLLAAAERRLVPERSARAARLAADPDDAFALVTQPGRPVALFWRDEVVARLTRGRRLLGPALALHRSLDALSAGERTAVVARLDRWLADGVARHLQSLRRIALAAADAATPPSLRALIAPLADAGGIVARDAVAAAVMGLDREQRRAAGKLGIRLGALDIFCEPLLKPEAMRWRMALIAARAGRDAPTLPPPGAVVLAADTPIAADLAAAGYRTLGDRRLRVDLVERLARQAHDARDGRGPFAPDPALAVSLGLKPDTIARLMRLLGFHAADQGWTWRGRPAPAPPRPHPGTHFEGLAELIATNG